MTEKSLTRMSGELSTGERRTNHSVFGLVCLRARPKQRRERDKGITKGPWCHNLMTVERQQGGTRSREPQ